MPHQVHIALFQDVTNSEALQKQLLAGNSDFEYAFIDASCVISLAHILSAVHQAVYNLLVSKRLRTHNVHSEIVFSLSSTNNISEAFRRFGVGPGTTSLLCVKISFPSSEDSAEAVRKHLAASVQGLEIDPTTESLSGLANWAKISKYYKLNTSRGASVSDYEKELAELEIVGKMMMRATG